MKRHAFLTDRLTTEFEPLFLEVVDESHLHSGGAGRESHFRITVASERFDGAQRLARHRLVHAALGEAFRAGLHALTISAFGREEWEAGATGLASPQCAGAKKSEES